MYIAKSIIRNIIRSVIRGFTRPLFRFMTFAFAASIIISNVTGIEIGTLFSDTIDYITSLIK